MNWRDSPQGFGTLSRALHWSGVLVVAGAIALIEAKGWFPKGSPTRDGLKTLHFQLGAMALLLTLARIAWRSQETVPPITPEPPAWQDLLGRAMHIVFYALLVALPVTGVAMLQAHGDAVVLLGVTLPTLVATDPTLRGVLREVHEFLGNATMVLIAVHVGAALYHHWVQRDDTLARMMPRG